MGDLLNSFKITNLDLENSDPTGLFRLDTITQYGPLVTGAPTTNGITSTNPGPARNFFQDFIPSNTYLSAYKIGGFGRIQRIFGTSRFDLSDSAPTAPYFVLTQDTVTQYGRLVTGPPVLRGLPGNGGSFPVNPGPASRFNQQFFSFSTYSDSYSIIPGYSKTEKLFYLSNIESLSSYKEDQDPTSYPQYITGTPTTKSNPGPFNKFKQTFNPENVYLINNPIRGRGRLRRTVANTNLDVENSRVDGGIPYKEDKDPTSYPETVTGTPTTRSNPGPFSKFKHSYEPQNTYLDEISNNSEGRLISTVANTNLDVENKLPNGGIPYKQDKDPTRYPKRVTGTPYPDANPGAPEKFYQEYNPQKEYLDDVGEGILDLTFDSTNLDVENKSPNGGIPYKQDKDPTIYPKRVTGTPNADFNPGAPEKFYQEYNPQKEYLDDVGEGILDLTFDSTNLDVENEFPNGGIPYKQDKDPTAPKNTLPTGTPLNNGVPGPFTKFNQVYNPETTYLSKNPIKTVESRLSEWSVPGLNSDPKVLDKTELDNVRSSNNRNSSAFKYSTFVDSLTVAPPYRKNSNLLHLILTNNDNNQKIIKYDAYDFTRLDRESPLVGKYILEGRSGFIYDGITGGIPYKPDETDPTIYPVTSLKVGSVKGYNVVAGRGATKYAEPYDPPAKPDDRRVGLSSRKPTYLEYIQNFI
jgi:hypothetical protein